MTAGTVTFGMPVYNGAAHLDRAVTSLLSQTRDDFELIISDNGSEDGTAAIAARYAEKDPRVTVLTHAVNRGAAWNFRHVFQQGHGTYFAWTAADDFWDPRFLEQCVSQLEAHPEAVTCVTDIQPVSRSGASVGEPYGGLGISGQSTRARWRAALANPWLHAATYGVMRRAALAKTRLILPYIGSDHVMMAELALQGSIVHIPETLAYKLVPGEGELYRTHAEAMEYLGGPSRAPWLLWARLTKELVLSVHHVRPDDGRLFRLSLDAVASYLTARWFVNDAKHAIVRLRAS